MNDEPLSRWLTLSAGAAGVTLVAGIDYVSGIELRLFPLYFVPIGLVAWKSSRSAAMSMACLSALGWAVANAAAGRDYSSAVVWPINLTAMLVAFGTIAFLLSELQGRLRLERDLARKDALTGLPNSRAFREHGNLLLAVARRSGWPVTLAYLDLDNFKAINDQHGHKAGDRALIETAEALKRRLRASDLVARLGGDEFAMLLPNTSLDAAQASLERIRADVADCMQRNAWPTTVSVGALTYTRAPTTLEDAVHDADSLMYKAKTGGRDRLSIESVEPK